MKKRRILPIAATLSAGLVLGGCSETSSGPKPAEALTSPTSATPGATRSVRVQNIAGFNVYMGSNPNYASPDDYSGIVAAGKFTLAICQLPNTVPGPDITFYAQNENDKGAGFLHLYSGTGKEEPTAKVLFAPSDGLKTLPICLAEPPIPTSLAPTDM